MLRVRDGGDEAVEIAVPESVRARAEEIVRLSQGGGVPFASAREVLVPALVYGLAHMQERYRQAALREGVGSRTG
jgi:hypothetical protein